jgi:hypothetical protein
MCEKLLKGAIAVFKEVTTSRPQFTTTGFSADHSSDQYPQYAQVQQQQVQQTDMGPEQAGFTFDGSIFNSEDLGQFWLWKMDPHIEDCASWQSGDDYT